MVDYTKLDRKWIVLRNCYIIPNMNDGCDKLNFEDYIKQGEPDKSYNCYAWQTAIGLQAVDGLIPSEYLLTQAKRNIEGEISIEEVKSLVSSYYESKELRTQDEINQSEADMVSINIRNLLASKAFTFSIVELIGIHGSIFKGVFKHAGQVRNYNISKKEWVLDGESVFYANSDMILKTLEYDFENERSFSYVGLSEDDIVKHFSRFIANIWQIHPFREGNTRTCAVFAIKYLSSLGYEVTNDGFIKNSWYFRNALVRANYSNVKKGISMETKYLEVFFRNIIFGEKNSLQNRYLHILASELPENLPINAKNLPINAENLPINKTQTAIITILRDKPNATYDGIAEIIGKTRETVRTNLRKLENLGLIARKGSRKSGIWVFLNDKV